MRRWLALALLLSPLALESAASAERLTSLDVDMGDISLNKVPRRRPGSSWQRSRDGVLLIIGVPVTGADPCQ